MSAISRLWRWRRRRHPQVPSPAPKAHGESAAETEILYLNEKWVELNVVPMPEVKAGVALPPVKISAKFPAHAAIDDIKKAALRCGARWWSGTLKIERPSDGVRVVPEAGSDGIRVVLETGSGRLGLHPTLADERKFSCYAEARLLGTCDAEPTDTPGSVVPVLICRRLAAAPSAPSQQRIPIGIPGLADLLFPSSHGPNDAGFEKPAKGSVMPRVLVVRGGAGTGKTTMATQMMASAAKAGFRCAYWCSKDSLESIRKTAIAFSFCEAEEFETWEQTGIVSFTPIGDNYLEHLREIARRDKALLSQKDVLFFDSLNVAELRQNDAGRQALWDMMDSYKALDLLSVFLLEDYEENCTHETRQLISDCSFLADVVITLGKEHRQDFETKCLSVEKKRYGAHIFGSHTYKICGPDHGLSNIEQGHGIVVFPNIHRHLAAARRTGGSLAEEAWTGISHLDSILLGETHTPQSGHLGCMPVDSTMVIRGERGGHKLPLGMNILMAGMWKSLPKGGIAAHKDVLLVLLDEEVNLDIRRVAMARSTKGFVERELPGIRDNGECIRWKPPSARVDGGGVPCDGPGGCEWHQLFRKGADEGKKVFVRKWCAEIVNRVEDGTRPCRKLCIAGFRPGCITPEEFIHIVSKLLGPGGRHGESAFSRVLFASTAHLEMRFPLLAKESLFIPALVDLFKARHVLSVFIDVGGKGSSETLSYGLSALADYLVCMDSFEHTGDERDDLQLKLPVDLPGRHRDVLESLCNAGQGYVWSRMLVENIRGKEYSRPCHAVTVRPNPDENELFIVNVKDPDAISVGIDAT